MKKFELPEQPQKTNTSKDFTVAKEAIANLDKFDYAWKTYSHKIEKRFTAAIKYIEELEARLKECEGLRIGANNEAAKEYALKCEVVEERAELKRENQRLRAENLAVKTLVEDAKKQQPEIPEFVGKYIKETADPIHEMCAWSEHYGDNGTKCDDPELSKMLDWFGMNRNMFYEAVIKGYTVTKEKRFYLKNRMTGCYLYKAFGGIYAEQSARYINDDEDFNDDCKFTQQEIDSMETGSYEQLEVEE